MFSNDLSVFEIKDAHLAAGCTDFGNYAPGVCMNSLIILIPLYREEHTDKLPGAQFWLHVHPACAQNKTLISNTAYIC